MNGRVNSSLDKTEKAIYRTSIIHMDDPGQQERREENGRYMKTSENGLEAG